MSDADEIKESTDIFNVIKQHDREIRNNIYEASGVYFPEIIRPREELEVLFQVENLLQEWNAENNDTLAYEVDVVRKVPDGRSLLKRIADRARGTWYGSVISIEKNSVTGELPDHDYISPDRIVVLFPEYKNLAESLNTLLKPKEGIVENYNWQDEIYDWRKRRI